MVKASLITLADFFLSLPKVFESFVDYVAVEQLDGDNKYDAGEHGLQVTWALCTRVLGQRFPLLSGLLLICELTTHSFSYAAAI